MIWRIAAILVTGLLHVVSARSNADMPLNTTMRAGVARHLASAPGQIAACYTPFHNDIYPLTGGGVDVSALKAAIDDDFRLMSQYFTHVRTYHAMHYDIEVAPIAAKYGLKLYLGVFMTSESWGSVEINAAANAIKYHSDAVEVVLVGNENLVNFAQRASDILATVNRVKAAAGGDAWRVKYGTVQRITEYVDTKFDYELGVLNANLDILGVNIYPFFNNNYNGANPTELLDAQWKAVTSRYPQDKIRLTETGFPTAGGASWLSPNVQPSLEASVGYYQGVRDWTPSGSEHHPKFWFQAFDRRPEDPMAGVELERHFGFFTSHKQKKRDGFPRSIESTGSSPTSTPTPTPTPTTSPSTGPAKCGMEPGMDYVGLDIGSVLASSFGLCMGKCRAVRGCGAFTWTSYNGGTCWLKSSRGQTVANGGAYSGVLCNCALETDVDYLGNDLGSEYGARAADCFDVCARTYGCKAFTWNSYNGGTCWLKSAKGNTQTGWGVVSGQMC